MYVCQGRTLVPERDAVIVGALAQVERATSVDDGSVQLTAQHIDG